MSRDTVGQIAVGLPGAGKTTFLAALWHVLDRGNAPSGLKLDSYEGDQTYLNTIVDNWIRCLQTVHTPVGAAEAAVMKITDGKTITALALPDFSGETYSSLWTTREWDPQHLKHVEQAQGVLLFVHPNAIVSPDSIHAVNAVVGHPEGNDATQPNAWHKEKSPTQIILVDVLQSILGVNKTDKPLRVCVIVSAWDLVPAATKKPEAWFAANLPLLQQFLQANHEDLEYTVIGISAQGGDLPADANKLRRQSDATQRIKVVSEHGPPDDITRPIAWISRPKS